MKIIKSTKYCLKKGRRKEGELGERNRENELVHSTIYVSIELSK
jgi:hypothetical protein